MVQKKKITVVGSLNMDLVVSSRRHPEIGETITGTSFSTVPGGKGGNQAVAASRLGANVSFVGAVGNDFFGNQIKETFEKENIDTTHIKEIDDSTGIASITVSENDNSIVIIPGANAYVDRKCIDDAKETIINSDIVLTQLEIPLDTVDYLSTLCRSHEVDLIINPAPAIELTDNIVNNTSIITPNELELEQLTHFHKTLKMDHKDKLIVTVGKEGSYYYNNNEKELIKGYKTNSVDTTGAGDCFNGALAVALVEGKTRKESIEFANMAASLNIEKFGAQAGMPTYDMVMERVLLGK